MPTRNVVITEHQQELIESLVGSGRYQNASEVLREGLRLIEEREVNEAAKLQALREAAQVGWDAYASGQYIEIKNEEDAKTFWAGIDAEVAARTTKAG